MTRRTYRILLSLILTVLLAGVGMVAYPYVADYVNSLDQNRAIGVYRERVEHIDPVDYAGLLQEAHDYNAKLFALSGPMVQAPDALPEYADILAVTRRASYSIMGTISIEKIGVRLPIYHGTVETVLQIAVGHLEGSSLPVGGPSTHAVLTGHRGLPSARLFTDIDKLVIGDYFSITILKETIWYQVDQILTVLPMESQALQIERGQDRVTLVTCTPYGINTHRLLVRGTRSDPPETWTETDLGELYAPLNDQIRWILTITCGLLSLAALTAAITLWVQHLRRKRRLTQRIARTQEARDDILPPKE